MERTSIERHSRRDPGTLLRARPAVSGCGTLGLKIMVDELNACRYWCGVR